MLVRHISGIIVMPGEDGVTHRGAVRRQERIET